MNYSELLSNADAFLKNLFIEIDSLGITIPQHWNLDHLCFRVSSNEEYKLYKEFFNNHSELLIESMVNGRWISTFKIPKLIYFRNWTVDVIELPQPKVGVPTVLGFEHIEFVCDKSFETLVGELEMRSDCGKRFNINSRGLSKDFNQELEVTFSKGSVKFHHLSLESVVELEKNKDVFNALMDLKILSAFKKYNPLVVGTFPLGIAVEGSDVDIVLNATNLVELKNELLEYLRKNLPSEESITTHMHKTHHPHCLTMSFYFRKIKFELYAEDRDTTSQNGFLHFLAEEKIIKIMGKSFKAQILQLKESGIKTEPAFFQLANGINTNFNRTTYANEFQESYDPYQALLDFQKFSEKELSKVYTK